MVYEKHEYYYCIIVFITNSYTSYRILTFWLLILATNINI